MIRLNWGCGNYPKFGWINCDKRGLHQRWEYASIADQIVEMDLTVFPYTFGDSSVDMITISHCLNQIDRECVPKIMKEVCRILKPSGIVRVTDDEVESPRSPIFDKPHFHAKWKTGAKGFSQYLQDAGLRVCTLTKTTTCSWDKTILVANHPECPDTALFFIEGIKPDTDLQLTDNACLLQHALHNALWYFLYGSGRGVFKALIHRRWLSGIYLNKIIHLSEKVGISRYRWQNRSFGKMVDITTYAETLATAYCLWEEILTTTKKNSTSNQIIPLGQSYNQWLDRGGQSHKYKPVHDLRSQLKNAGGDLFARAIVHGSIATLDDVPGFSDMDLAFIISTSTLKAPMELMRLRRLADEILILTYAFDPFMHHGPYYISEIDLLWYPEAIFPTVLFAYGIDLLNNSQELKITTRSSGDVTDQQLDVFEEFFKKMSLKPVVAKDSYELEWVLGNAMILPALYLQRLTGEFRYKRDTFLPAEKDFSPETWEPIQTATSVRLNLSYRPNIPKIIMRFAAMLNWPIILQWFARHHPQSVERARMATTVLGIDYPKRVLILLNSIRSKLSDTGKNV